MTRNTDLSNKFNQTFDVLIVGRWNLWGNYVVGSDFPRIICPVNRNE